MSENDPFDLQRFVTAQAPVFDSAINELKAGRKRSHWMWFIFPQLRGLGRSSTATFYGIGGLEEARAYLRHPVLGPRLDLAVNTAVGIPNRSLHEIFDSPDDMKFRSSMTLFAVAADKQVSSFRMALGRLCDGQLDDATIALLG